MRQPNQKGKTLLQLIVNFVLLFALYQLLLAMEWTIGMILYMVAGAALVVAYYILNEGFGKPEAEALPDTWSEKEKSAYLAHRAARHEKAKKLLVWLLPIILVLGIDFLCIYIPELFRMFS